MNSERQQIIQRIERLARILDTRYRIPGTRIRFGLDPLLGLIPGLGDLATMGMSAYLIVEARRLGLPKRVLARMVGNVVFDTTLGAVPLVGDAADFFFRSNSRNVRLMLKQLESRGEGRAAERSAAKD